MQVKSHSYRTHTLITDDGDEVELEYEPHYEDDILAERIGNKLVVAYLVQDDGCGCNPMEGGCQGNIYTKSPYRALDSSITDNDSELYSALGVDGYGGVDVDKLFPCDPYLDWKGIQQKRNCLRDIAARQYLDKVGADFDLIQQWLDANDYELVEGETLDEAFAERRNEVWRDLEDCNGTFSEEVEELAVSLYPQYWQQIAGPFVVPMYYDSERGDTTITPHGWDGDTEDLPNCVWVADEGAIENITPFPEGVLLKQVEVWPDPSVYAVVDSSSSTEVELFRGGWSKARRWVKDNLPAPDDADLRQAAKAYAEAVCGEYAKWCSGEVYGCIVQTFNLATESEDGGEPQWVPGDPDRGDQVWGFIGHEYALEALKSEFFDPTVKTLKEVAHA